MFKKMDLPESLRKLMEYEKNINCPEYITPPKSPYSPENGNWFLIKSYWIDSDKMFYFSVDSNLNKYFYDREKNKLLFLIHPESELFFQTLSEESEIGPNFMALPTSSYRTVLAHPIYNEKLLFFVKLSLDKNIWNINRMLPKNEILRSIQHEKLLETTSLPEGCDYFREVIGMIPKIMERGGMIIREIPSDILNSKIEVVPFFSLYTIQNNLQIPILQLSCEYNLTPEEWVNKYIFRPFCKQYLYLAIVIGVTTESHGQNILLKMINNKPVGFYYRDLNGFNFDFDYRKELKNEILTFGNVFEEYCQDVSVKNLETSLYKYFSLFINEMGKLQVFKSINLIKNFKYILEREFFNYGIRIRSIDDSFSIVKEKIIELRKKIKKKK